MRDRIGSSATRAGTAGMTRLAVVLALTLALAPLVLASCSRGARVSSSQQRAPAPPSLRTLAAGPTRMDITTAYDTLRSGRHVTLPLPVPELPDTVSDYDVALSDRPLLPEQKSPLTFAEGREINGSRVARIVFAAADDVRASVFSGGSVFTTMLAGERLAEYERLNVPADKKGRTCAVTGADDARAAERFFPKDVKAKADSLPRPATRTLRIAIGIGPELRRECERFGMSIASIERGVQELLHDANLTLKRDLRVRLVLSGTPFLAPDNLYAGSHDLLKASGDFLERQIRKSGQTADLAHLIDMGDGGQAYTGSVCAPGFLGRGQSATVSVTIKNGLLSFLHEVGHQLGAPHSFNRGNIARHPRGAYEPGEGRSLMSYPEHGRQNYYHASSIDFIETTLAYGQFPQLASCGIDLPIVGARPIVNARKRDWDVPERTPIEIEAEPDATVQAYRWDEYDKAAWPDREPPFFPSNEQREGARIYPPLDWLLKDSVPDSSWPTAGENMRFRLLGFSRDDVSRHADIEVRVRKGGRFFIKSARCTQPCAANSNVDVEWEKAETTASPYDVKTLTAYVLDESTRERRQIASAIANAAGRATIALPADMRAMKKARIVLRADGSVFFALSPKPFAIQ